MIPIRTALRVMPAAWLAVPLAVVAAWYASLLPSPPGYGTAATAAASGTLPFIGAFVAGSAAWEGARLQRAGIWGGPWVRRGARIAAGLLVGPIAAGLLAVAVAVVVAHARAGAFPPDLAILGVMAVDVITYASLGFALGLVAPLALAVPLAAILALFWTAFVPAMYPVWLRHLTGMYRDCCGLAETLAPQAVVASIVMDVAIVATAALAVQVGRPRRWRAAAAATVLVAASFVGIQAASSLTFAPVTARDPSLLTCTTGNGVEVCLWPEHSPSATTVVGAIGDVRANWEAAGIEAPAVFTEAEGQRAPGTLEVRLPDVLTKDGVIVALAVGMLPAVPNCAGATPGGAPVATTGGIAFAYLEAWYAAAGGLSSTSLQALDMAGDEINPSVLTVVKELSEATVSVRRNWAANAAAISQSCDDTAPDLRVGK